MPIATEYMDIAVGSPENVGTKCVVGARNLVVSLILLMARNDKRGSMRPRETPSHLPRCIRDQ